MSVKDIVPFGDPILRKTAKPVDVVNSKIIKLLEDMAETLYATDGRAGLAAPQVGILRRIIVMDCGDGLIELINPQIVAASGEQLGPEGCLSYPGYYGNVKRADYVKITTLNRHGKSLELEGNGFLARCIQHEIDHLNGVLFIDHVQDQWLYHEQKKQKVSVLEVIKLANQ
ncbi:peptide deformylase [Paenibacillus sp. LMG 31456]|uniref:Peptide deformylase n=1 Tax=Paenibacillus foliorum TaxID=2654974 RepID=A0A972GY41_9BACL|nr:peptide deformylase [Paenibacillus foliorum]NOU96659.1 peptide deformylase [Paenibacillus foliorum]